MEGNNPLVVVVGSCMRDLVSCADRLPKPGETVHGSKFVAGYGGKGANQCISASRLGVAATMIGKVGNDSHGEAYIKTFKENGVNADYVKMTDAIHTGVAMIFVDGLGQNSIIIVDGANSYLTQADVHEAEDVIKTANVIVTQLETPDETAIAALRLAKKHNVKSIMNAAPGCSNINPELCSLPDIFCVNESETELIVGIPVPDVASAEIAVKALVEKGCNIPIITLGEKGVVLTTDHGKSTIHIPAISVKAVDTTGAGDSFIGALAYYLAAHPKLELPIAVKRACDIASMSVQVIGTHPSFPWKRDLPAEFFA